MDKPFDLLKSHESGVFLCQIDVHLLTGIIKENWTLHVLRKIHTAIFTLFILAI